MKDQSSFPCRYCSIFLYDNWDLYYRHLTTHTDDKRELYHMSTMPEFRIKQLRQERERMEEVRKFESGATRNSDADRIDPEGFLSPLVIERYCEYLHKHRFLENGLIRESDNWQQGIPLKVYMKGLWRHFLHAWTRHRGYAPNDPKAGISLEEDLCAIIFNSSGYLFELLKDKSIKKLE